MAWLQTLHMNQILIYGCAFGIPIVAICSSMVVAIVKAVLKHRERMAMIEQGLHPDSSPKDAQTEEYPAKRPAALDETQPYLAHLDRPAQIN